MPSRAHCCGSTAIVLPRIERPTQAGLPWASSGARDPAEFTTASEAEPKPPSYSRPIQAVLGRGLEIDDGVWNHAIFSKNRDRLLNQDLAGNCSPMGKSRRPG